MVASSQLGQPAITDSRMGSIFTSLFVKALTAVTNKKYKDDSYIAWPQILKKASDQAFKESRGYDIGGGVAGKQKAVFEAFVSNEINLADRFLNMIIKFEEGKN
jgi:hypothetical protein